MEHQTKLDLLRPELYFLLQKFLSASPLQETYKVLCKELEDKKILPTRLDWEGNKHDRTFEELKLMYPHIGADHLLEICGRIGPILDKEIPPAVPGVCSLLGTGKQSLLRSLAQRREAKGLEYHAARRHGMPMCDPFLKDSVHNIVNILIGRALSGPITRATTVHPSRYSQMQLQRQTLGHLSAVYCLLFDRSGRYIITGADDLLVKVWSAFNGRLLATFRGASAEITDIDVNLENTLLAAGSIDRVLRVWDLQTGAPVAVLTAHTGMITSVHFCPSARWDLRYLVTTSSDGSVAFWTYTHDARNRAQFISKPILYQEKLRPGQSQMICSAFSPGGTFLAAGSADHHVRAYLMRGDEGPLRILETEVHTDRVDSIVWAHRGVRFVSGSKDGTAFIWHFERQQWKSIKLCMSTKLPNAKNEEQEEAKKVFVTMVAWDLSDDYLVTAVSDHCLKVWRSETGQLERILTGHTDGIYVLESHPKDPYVMLSTGHDGHLFVWDILRGKHVAHFQNFLENGQGPGAVFDAKWSPDGLMFAASDSHGHILTFGFGPGLPQLKVLPKELFYHTDYRPLVRDAEHYVLDEQTQIPPHAMPPPFLVDVDGNPYPPMLQRLVPGRENCTSEQLVPNIIIGNGGRQEVIQAVDAIPRSDIDRRIAALAQRQPRTDENEGENDANEQSGNPIPRAIRNGPRRSGDIEGVRQSTGDWNGDVNVVWKKNVVLQPLSKPKLYAVREIVNSIHNLELAEYHKEIKRRPLMITTGTITSTNHEKNRKRRRNGAPARRTRANPSMHEEVEPEHDAEGENEESNNSSSHDEASKDLSMSEPSSDSDESSGYSDWVADQGVNLEPPKRSKRKSAHRKVIVDDDDEDDFSFETMANTIRSHISAFAETKAQKSTENNAKVPPVPKPKNGEVPEMYKALEWLSETVPKKAPYCPQMGDEVVYIVQGHKMYINAVKIKKVYNINNRDLPWMKHTLKNFESVKIVGIKYEIRPPRLCCLKLVLLDNGQLTNSVFTVKYHDMADVLDFFVLKQTYDYAIERTWRTGEKFRCMIDDCWWVGTVLDKSPLSEEYPDSWFMCYEIQWDNGECERMSPWDLESIREDRLPYNVGEAAPVLKDEIDEILYQPTEDEWPEGDRDKVCGIIEMELDEVMMLAIAEPFLSPVDFNLYPTYAYIVEYPIDLTTIKARLTNRFYRRIISALFDVRYLASNAEKFNSPHTIIVRNARIVTDLLLEIFQKSPALVDVAATYRQLLEAYESSSDSDGPGDHGWQDTDQPGPSTATQGRQTLRTPANTRNLRFIGDWRDEAKRIYERLSYSRDSNPFQVAVCRLTNPEYYQLIDTPMDLSIVRDGLWGCTYESPNDFIRDVRLIFQNSKVYNTNKRSKIYAMTERLSSMFEEEVGKLTNLWRRLKNKGCTLRKSSRKLKQSSKVADSDSDTEESEKENYEKNMQTGQAETRKSGRYNHVNKITKAATSSSDSSSDEHENGRLVIDEDDDDDEEFKPGTRETQRKPMAAATTSSSSSNSSSDTNGSRENAATSSCSDSGAVNQNGSKEAESSNDSDYEPLSRYKKALAGTSNHKRKSNCALTSSDYNTESSTSDSDSTVAKNRPMRVARQRKRGLSDSDSDNLPLKRLARGSDSDDSDRKRIVTVSSRGRVRKLTERARLLLKSKPN